MDTRVILLVEDNPDDVELTLRAFERSKIANEMVVARDGVEALEILHGKEGEEPPVIPDLVMLDLKLPRLDGFEVLERLRKDPRTACLPVVILTSSDEDEDIINGYKLGANSYVRKPVDFDRFVEAVQRLQVYWLLVNQPPPKGG